MRTSLRDAGWRPNQIVPCMLKDASALGVEGLSEPGESRTCATELVMEAVRWQSLSACFCLTLLPLYRRPDMHLL